MGKDENTVVAVVAVLGLIYAVSKMPRFTGIRTPWLNQLGIRPLIKKIVPEGPYPVDNITNNWAWWVK